jgi:hypothetical protein
MSWSNMNIYLLQIAVFWVMTPCIVLGGYHVWEEPAASIFRVKFLWDIGKHLPDWAVS